MPTNKPKLAVNKTKPTDLSAEEFIHSIEHPQKRADSLVLFEMMHRISGEEPVLWNNSFIGFGTRRHVSPTSGREADWMRIGFAPRKANLSLYFGIYVEDLGPSLEKLGKYKSGMGCVYVNKLADIDLKVLEEMVESGWAESSEQKNTRA